MFRQLHKSIFIKKIFGIPPRNLCVLADHKLNEAKKLHPKRNYPNPTVAAVFENLKNQDSITTSLVSDISLDEIILNAKTVNGLLNIAENSKDIKRKHALKIVSILAEWTTIQRAKLDDFENDARFTKLCRMLGKTVNYRKDNVDKSSITNLEKSLVHQDIDTILTIKGIDEASKLVASITLEQMVKVMKNLALKKRRSTPLLRSLSFNISGKDERLTLKQCSDILYAMASLNFSESALISKICDDIQVNVKENPEIKKSTIIGSMLTSLSLLKYRDTSVLDCLSEWIVINQAICRTQDVQSLCLTLAALNYMPVDLEETIKTKIAPSLSIMDFKNIHEYLSYVWSLLAMKINVEEAYDHVLQDSFIESLKRYYSNDLPASAKLKLLNINAGVKLFFPSYKGAMLSREKHKEIYDVPLMHNSEKQVFVKAMLDALASLIPESNLRQTFDSNMGFSIDAEFRVDKNGNFLSSNATDYFKRFTVTCHDYHDYCQGSSHHHLTGVIDLNHRLLQRSGITTLSVPYYDFSANDLLLKRVQYLQKLIKTASKSENNV